MERQENTRDLARRILALLEPELATEGYALLDVRVFKGGGRLQIRIYLDTPAGITMDEVAKASRSVGILMDEADPVPGRYVMEVSSPGIRRPLRTPAHFLEAVGKKVDLKVAGDERPRRIRGLLASSGEGKLVIEQADNASEQAEIERVEIPWEQVLEANLDADFDPRALINADRRRRKDQKREKRAQRKKSRRSPRPRKGRNSTPENSGD